MVTVKEFQEMINKIEQFETLKTEYSTISEKLLKIAENLSTLAKLINPSISNNNRGNCGIVNQLKYIVYSKMKNTDIIVNQTWIKTNYPELKTSLLRNNLLVALQKCPFIEKNKNGNEVLLHYQFKRNTEENPLFKRKLSEIIKHEVVGNGIVEEIAEIKND